MWSPHSPQTQPYFSWWWRIRKLRQWLASLHTSSSKDWSTECTPRVFWLEFDGRIRRRDSVSNLFDVHMHSLIHKIVTSLCMRKTCPHHTSSHNSLLVVWRCRWWYLCSWLICRLYGGLCEDDTQMVRLQSNGLLSTTHCRSVTALWTHCKICGDSCYAWIDQWVHLLIWLPWYDFNMKAPLTDNDLAPHCVHAHSLASAATNITSSSCHRQHHQHPPTHFPLTPHALTSHVHSLVPLPTFIVSSPTPPPPPTPYSPSLTHSPHTHWAGSTATIITS